MNKKHLIIGAALLAAVFFIPFRAPARHHSAQNDDYEYQDHGQHHDQQVRGHHADHPQKKDRTVLGSTLGLGALGAITAGAAGSGKWVPLGLAGGALAGWAIGKAVEHRKKRKFQKRHRTVRDRKHSYAY